MINKLVKPDAMFKYTIATVFTLLTSVSIWSQQPLPLPPLTTMFLDGATAVNDGKTPNTINIGIYNYNNNSTSRANDNSYTIKKGESILIRFIIDPGKNNEEPKRPWALTTSDWYSQVTVQAYFDEDKKVDSRWDCSNDDQLIDATYRSYTIEAKEDILIKPGQFVKIAISGLLTKLPDGPAQAFVFYNPTQHPPGEYNELNSSFGNIQKSPLSIRDNKVGIGTNQTNAATLNVKGGMRAEGGALQPGKDNNTGYSFNNGDGSTGISSRKDGQVGVYANGMEVASFTSENGSPSLAVNGDLWVKERFFPPTSNQIYYVQAGNGMVWDVYNFSKDPGGRINLVNNAFGNNKQQQWKLLPGDNGYYWIQNVNSGLVARFSNNIMDQQNQQNGLASQQFKLIAAENGSYYIESKQEPGKVLTIANTTYGSTIEMTLQEKNNQPNQKFLFIEPSKSGKNDASLIKLGSDEKYQISETPNALAINAESGTSVAFTNGSANNLTIESNTGNIATRGAATIGGGATIGGSATINGNTEVRQSLTVSGNSQTNGNLNVNGRMTVKNAAPIISKTIYGNPKPQSNNWNSKYCLVDTGIPKNDYIGIVAGYDISEYDARDDNKGRFTMRIIDNGNTNLQLEVMIYADQDVNSVTVNAIFFRKEMVEVR